MDLSVGGRVERRGAGRVNLVWNKGGEERAVQSGQAASSAVKFDDKTLGQRSGSGRCRAYERDACVR
jgi:hypothetical protein